MLLILGFNEVSCELSFLLESGQKTTGKKKKKVFSKYYLESAWCALRSVLCTNTQGCEVPQKYFCKPKVLPIFGLIAIYYIYYYLKLNSCIYSRNPARMVAYQCQHSDRMVICKSLREYSSSVLSLTLRLT